MTEHEFRDEKNPPHDDGHGTGAEQDPRRESPENNSASGAGDQDGMNNKPHPISSGGPRSEHKWSDGYKAGEEKRGKFIEAYEYVKADGWPYLLVKRFERIDENGKKWKNFPQYHYVQETFTPNTHSPGSERNWHPGPPDGPKVPYMLPELVAAPKDEFVYIPEGEKDANSIFDCHLLVTTSSGGVDGWTNDLNQWFDDRICIIVRDNDAPGKRFARLKRRNLRPHARRVVIIDFEGYKDVTDYLRAKYPNTPEGWEAGKQDLLQRAEFALALDELASLPLQELDAAKDKFCKDRKIGKRNLNKLLQEYDNERKLEEREAREDDEIESKKPILSEVDHFQNAEKFIEAHFQHEDRATLLHHQAVFYGWRKTHYAELPDEQLRSTVWKFLASAVTINPEGEITPLKPNKNIVANVSEALAAQAQLLGDIKFPYWEGDELVPAREVLSCTNGLLHLPTRRLLPHTPTFRNIFALDYAYEPDAPTPEQWLKFLNELWEDDQESIETLQEEFGYMLTPDTSLQKIPMLIGPKRSGKGTIGRVLSAMLGEVNVAGPTLASLAGLFGLQSLINKPLAIISDARIGGKTDSQVIIERLLAISGEDRMTVPRKFLGDWHGQLPTRFMILTNLLPKLGDASGAIVSRFIILKLTKSFFGREDHQLFDKLRPELPGILNWSLEGLDRLRERGYFRTPEASKQTLATFENLSNPVGVFLEEECKLGTDQKISCSELYNAWTKWCEKQGRNYTGTSQQFGADLHAAVPEIETKTMRVPESRIPVRRYVGVGLLM